MNKLMKTLSATMIIATLTTTSVFALEAEATKNQTGSYPEYNCPKHGNYADGHYTKVTRTESGGRTWGLAAVGNPNSNGSMKLQVQIGSDYYGTVNGINYVQTATYNQWGDEQVRSSHR